MEDKLLGHLLKANDAETDAEVRAFLANEPGGQSALKTLERALAPLQADREEIEPRPDLWVRTLSRVAEHMTASPEYRTQRETSHTEEMIRRASVLAQPATVRPAVRSAPPPEPAMPRTTSRRNILAAIGLTAAALALVFPVLFHVRQFSQRTACQNSMRTFYAAASGYSDLHEGAFPRVADGQPAATAIDVLRLAGFLSTEEPVACPVASVSGPRGSFAYSLGFRDATGELRGPTRSPDFSGIPLLADAPLRHGTQAVPCNHRHGQNVLFAGGNVQFITTTQVDGDDIFCNAKGLVGAGLFPLDAALGRPEERP